MVASFPQTRMRRNRQTPWIRHLVAETVLTVKDLIQAMFVVEGENVRTPIPSMPGIFRLSIDRLIDEARVLSELGLPAVILFPALEAAAKSETAQEAYNPDNLIGRAIRRLKQEVPTIGVFADVALDPYTSHGHDGLMEQGEILNDPTLEILSRQALALAQAGVDIVAPSDMMDGRIGTLRAALDAAGFQSVGICAYAAKYASAFYSPFRDAVRSSGVLQGDKATYQMDPANSHEALREVALDLHEGADLIMIKPGLPYLDIVQRVKTTFQVPVCLYHVSGEYAMLKAAADNGWIVYEKALMESVLCAKRAGADMIVTYGAKDLAKILLP